MMEHAYTVYIETKDEREDAIRRIQMEIARHLYMAFGPALKGVSDVAK